MGFAFVSAIFYLIVWLGSSEATSRGTLLDQEKAVNVTQVFEDWMIEHERVYPSKEEKDKRFAIFKTQFEVVENFNKQGKNKSYTVGLNHFSDMTNEEFKSAYTCTSNVQEIISTLANSTRSTENVPDVTVDYLDYDTCESIDWVADGYITPVRNQGSTCGSCWAFATVTAVEAIFGITWGIDKIVPLSVQQLVDCTTGSNKGCTGGYTSNAYDYIVQNRGITSDQNYPYTGKDGLCNYNKAKQRAASITSFDLVKANEDDLTQAVCRQPVTVGIDADNVGFKYYRGGVFNGGSCRSDMKALTHYVTIVGIGRDEKDQQYWKIKNSWGERWGERGYMRLLKNDGTPGGRCGVTVLATYPKIDVLPPRD